MVTICGSVSDFRLNSAGPGFDPALGDGVAFEGDVPLNDADPLLDEEESLFL